MNSIRQIQAINKRELEAGVSTSASWHRDFADTAYIYIGGLPYELNEGDVITIFSQFGEPVFINLVRDKETGKSKGFAFLKYEDQRSTDLAVDNLGGATLMGRTLRVDHTRYKLKEGEKVWDNTYGDEAEKERNESDEEVERKRLRSESVEDEQRPLLKEEKELQELMRAHDDDDPMKGYLIEQKQEEVQAAVAAYESGRRKEKRQHRHHRHHRHRSRREEVEAGDGGSKSKSSRPRRSSRSRSDGSRSEEDRNGHRRREQRSSARESRMDKRARDESRSP